MFFNYVSCQLLWTSRSLFHWDLVLFPTIKEKHKVTISLLQWDLVLFPTIKEKHKAMERTQIS